MFFENCDEYSEFIKGWKIWTTYKKINIRVFVTENNLNNFFFKGD